jgi:hypothetical protein
MWLACAGCSGEYTLTVPDQLAAAGGEAPVVVRLQKSEIAALSLPIKDADMRMQIADSSLRCCYTDKMGYACAMVPAPRRPDIYEMLVRYMDKNGREVSQTAPVYVWPNESKVVAVDADQLPAGGADLKLAVGAMKKIGESGKVIYLTRSDMSQVAQMHARLRGWGYPDGPILMWQREEIIVVPDDTTDLPRLVIETRMVGQISQLVKMFPHLETGICTSADDAKAYAQGGLTSVVVGSCDLGGQKAHKIVRCKGWAELAVKAAVSE